jgi:hypothetical protein
MDDINDFLRSENQRIVDTGRHGSATQNGPWTTCGTTSPALDHVFIGTPPKAPQPWLSFPTNSEPEFPEGGDPRFRAVLSEMLKLHISKSNDYRDDDDPYANYRAAEQIGVPAWQSCFARALEKVQRIANAAKGKKLNHESAENSFLDLANHVVIAYVLYSEGAD